MSEEEYRIESDTIGPVKIPKGALWGPQTERSRNNFPSGELMPLQIILAFLHLKKAAAESNVEVGDEPKEKGEAIEDAIAGLEKKEEIPVNPTEPTTPGDSGTINGSTEHGSGKQGMNSPQTGDNSNTVIWITVAILAAGAMMGTFVVARKRKSE